MNLLKCRQNKNEEDSRLFRDRDCRGGDRIADIACPVLYIQGIRYGLGRRSIRDGSILYNSVQISLDVNICTIRSKLGNTVIIRYIVAGIRYK